MTSKQISVEDYILIKNLLGTYQWRVDDGDSEGWASLFTEDGAFIGGLPDPYHGREQLKKIPEMVRSTFQDKMRHLSGNYSIEYGKTKDEAHARYYSLVTTWLKDQGPQFFQLSLCNVHLVRISGEWKIKSNNVKNLKE
jgi:hypothetical protein